MEYMIKIDSKNKTVDIYFGNSDISGSYKQSNNKKFYMVCDTLYSPNSSKEVIVLFTEKDVVFKKSVPNDVSVEDFWIFDDGSSLIISEEAILRLECDGKQRVSKKHAGIEKYGFYNDMLWCLGSNDDGNNVLFLYNIVGAKITAKIIPDVEQFGFENGIFWSVGSNDDGNTVLFIYSLEGAKSLVRVIPDIEYDDDEKEDLLSSEVACLVVNSRFVFLYSNGIDSIAYDISGKNVLPTSEELSAGCALLKEREEKRNAERIERAQSQYSYWTERLCREREKPYNESAIKRAETESKKYRERLLEFGIEIPAITLPCVASDESSSTNESVEEVADSVDANILVQEPYAPKQKLKKKSMWARIFSK